jgi:transposase
VKRKYLVSLTDEEIQQAKEVMDSINYSLQKRKRAQMLLLAHDNDFTDEEISRMTGISVRGIEEIRKRFSLNGFKVTINGKQRRRRIPLIDPKDEERLKQMAEQVNSITGKKRWNLKELSQDFVTSKGQKISVESVRRILKKYQ